QRDRQQALDLEVGFDVEGKRARFDLYIGRAQLRVGENERNIVTGNRIAFDLASAFYAALDQVSHGEADVGFERIDAGLVQAVAQRRYVGGRLGRDRAGRRAVECVPLGRLRRRHAECASAWRIGGPDKKARDLAVVADQERAALFELAVQIHHR